MLSHAFGTHPDEGSTAVADEARSILAVEHEIIQDSKR
jgi:hypothetical protein